MFEPVIVINATKGIVTVSRERYAASWRYYLEAALAACAHEPLEYLRVLRVGPFQALEFAFDALARDRAWMRAQPVMVHADVCGVVAALVAGESAAHARWTSLLNAPSWDSQ